MDWTKEYTKEYLHKYRANNRIKINRLARNTYNMKPKTKRRTDKQRAINREYMWKVALEKHNLTQAAYDALVVAQENTCAICKRSPQAKQQGEPRLHIDQDHATNKVRGLLCANCNTALGLLQDKIEVLSRAITYLTR